jgi:hypothetical protein
MQELTKMLSVKQKAKVTEAIWTVPWSNWYHCVLALALGLMFRPWEPLKCVLFAIRCRTIEGYARTFRAAQGRIVTQGRLVAQLPIVRGLAVPAGASVGTSPGPVRGTSSGTSPMGQRTFGTQHTESRADMSVGTSSGRQDTGTQKRPLRAKSTATGTSDNL